LRKHLKPLSSAGVEGQGGLAPGLRIVGDLIANRRQGIKCVDSTEGARWPLVLKLLCVK
jgi:hypothetical protein